MELIKQLEDTRDRTLTYFDLRESDLDKTYGPGKWSVRYLLHHITDAETVLYDRIRRAIAEPKQVVWAFRQDDWAEKLDYQNHPLALNKAIFSAVRAANIYLAQQFYSSLGNNEFVHSETGLRRLKDEMEKVAWHNEQHLLQIEQALGVKQ